MFNNFFFFRKSCRLWDNVEKYMAHRSCMLDKQSYTHVRACTRPSARRARARTHANTHTCNISCFSTATMIRELASVLRYTYIVRLVSQACRDKGSSCGNTVGGVVPGRFEKEMFVWIFVHSSSLEQQKKA